MLTTQELARAVKRALISGSFSAEPTAGRVMWTKNRLAGAIATTLIATAPAAVFAQSNIEGYVYGNGKAGTEVRLENTQTGAARTATITGSGSFRTPNVPPGRYKISYTDSAGATQTREVTVSIGAGTSIDSGNIETVVVTGETIRPIDLTQTESVTSLTSEQITQLPVARDIQQVAMLAPGVTQGDAGFLSPSGKPLVSFGGASPGENTYFVNGFNITDFRNFLGGATVPFEFYDQFELRTGGYSAEFGRSLGGVINAVTKRGTNNFEFGAAAYWQPDSLNKQSSSTSFINNAGQRQIRTDNSQDYNSELQVNLSAGGPIIQDRLFFYALGVFRNIRDDDAVGTTAFAETEDDSPFFGGKLDWQIADNHAVEYTYLRDDSTTDVDNFPYNSANRSVGALKSVGARDDGGQTHIARYSGTLFENFTLSALYGHSERTQSAANRDAVTGNPCTLVTDIRGGGNNPLSCWDSSGNGQVSDTTDERDAYRLDLTWLLGDHALKLGYDYEENLSDTEVEYEGGVGYRYSNTTPGSVINGGVVPPGVTDVVRQRYYSVSGQFEEKLSAIYLEDSWQVTDRLLVSLGLRNETLENFNKDGEEFLDFGSQLTPRLGFSFDLIGDGRTKLFGNAGRYTMPIATNTNIRFAGGEFFTEQYFRFAGQNADGTPILGANIGGINVLSDGTVPVPQEGVDRNIKPMYQDEFILGVQSQVTDSTTLGLKVTYRDLVRAVEDSAVVDSSGTFYYFLFNPGNDVTLRNPSGQYTTITADELGYPEAKRRHWAAELTFDHVVGNTLRLGGSYTWSHTYGNFEGVFQSDVQQDDAGITITFDTPGLAHFTNGNLPNDRRHNFKTYGQWTPAPDWTLSFSASAISGRPKNSRGNCPTAIDPDAYDQYCFYTFGVPTPRGSAGTLPWIYNIDLGVRYNPAFLNSGLSVGVDLINVFNFQEATRIQEQAQQPGDENAPADPSYGSVTYYQQPRYARFSVRWDF
jgi:outer membrane receptor for ferrienterochelin and colicin